MIYEVDMTIRKRGGHMVVLMGPTVDHNLSLSIQDFKTLLLEGRRLVEEGIENDLVIILVHLSTSYAVHESNYLTTICRLAQK